MVWNYFIMFLHLKQNHKNAEYDWNWEKLWLCYQFDQSTVCVANILLFPQELNSNKGI